MRRVTDIARTVGYAAGGLGAALLIGAGVWAWTSSAAAGAWAETSAAMEETLLDVSAGAGMRLRQVTVEGRGRTDSTEILAALDLPQGAPLLAFSPDAARERLESLPWVKRATVERHLPDRIHVMLEERTPIALWQNQGSFALIDAEGAVIDDLIAPFATLPVVVGPGAPEAAHDLFTLLDTVPELKERLKAAVFVGERRWNVTLDAPGRGSVEVRLPEQDTAAALQKLARLEREYEILERDLALIDLRLPDRLVVRVNDRGETPKPRKSGSGGRLPLTGAGRDA